MKKIIVLVALFLISCNQNKKIEISSDNTDSIAITSASNFDSQTDSKTVSATTSDFLIMQGKSIGGTKLLDDTDSLEKFGEPFYSDAAMGKAWLLWKGSGMDVLGNKATLAVYVTYNGSDMSKQVVKRIRVTSADFKTVEGAHTGMTFEEIEKLIPNLQKNSKMSNSEFAKGTSFYIPINSGICFEFKMVKNIEICTAIAIASVDEISNQPYLMLDSAEIQR